MRALLALALLALTALAGCSDSSDTPSPPAPEPALADALAAYRAGEAGANVERLGQWGGGSAEVDACGHWLFVDRGAAVAILDVSTPGAFEEVGSIAFASVEDVKVSDDCQWMFVGNDAEASMAPVGGLLPQASGGFHVVDVSDKSAPRPASYLPVGPRRGPHMVFYHQTRDGDELVLGANADVSINRFDRATGTLTELARYQADLATAFNRDPEVFDVLYQGWAHDMFVMEDFVAGKTLMYVANWDAGLRIVDLSDPAAPAEVGSWNDFPEGHEGNLHTVSTAWVGDRRITVGAVEVGFAVVGGYHYAMGTDRGVLYVWDTTDLSAPTLLGVWENPEGLPAGRDNVPGEEITSTHNLQLEDGRVYLAHYGLGLFVLDVSTPAAQAGPALLGYHKEPDDNVWDAVLSDGVLYTSGAAGVVALHYAADEVGPDGIDSRA